MRKDNEGNARSLVFVCLERSGQCCLAFLAGGECFKQYVKQVKEVLFNIL